MRNNTAVMSIGVLFLLMLVWIVAMQEPRQVEPAATWEVVIIDPTTGANRSTLVSMKTGDEMLFNGSANEKWGHYLVEGGSTGLAEITVDGMPYPIVMDPEPGQCDYNTRSFDLACVNK